MSAVDLVNDAIATHPVVIFSKTYCPYCDMAKSEIAEAGESVAGFQPPKTFELDIMGNQGFKIQAYLGNKTGRSTVPNVFIGGVPVGGGDEIASYVRSGVLKQMLTQAPTRLAAANKAEEDENAAVKHNNVSENGKTENENDDVETFVERMIKESPVIMFSKSYCPFCVHAKNTLHNIGGNMEGYVQAHVLELDQMGARGEQIQDYLHHKTGQRTVPNIFISSEHIGGNDDLSALVPSGQLDTKLRECYAARLPTASQPTAQAATNGHEATSVKEIVLGAGCFWGVQLAFQRINGVLSTEVGYSNGKFERVSYDAVCTGATESAEVVRVKYDVNIVSLQALLDVWASRHDFTSLNKQGNDVGTQYRSAIFYFDDEQGDAVRTWIDNARKEAQSKNQNADIMTDIATVHNYCAAEEYHQRYLEKKGQSAEKGDTSRIRCYG